MTEWANTSLTIRWGERLLHDGPEWVFTFAGIRTQVELHWGLREMAGLFHGIFTRLIFFKKVEKSIVLKNMEFIIDEGILKTEFYLPSGEVIPFGIKYPRYCSINLF